MVAWPRMVTARLGRGMRRTLARVSVPLLLLLALPSACGSTKSDFNDASGGTGGTGGTASGTLSTLLARCNGLCDKAQSAKCGNDTQGCHTNCSDSLDVYQHCTDEYDALLDCAEALSSVCSLYDSSGACDSEFGDYTHCSNAYCLANPSDAICT